MSPGRRGPDDPREWLRRARANLIRAKADRDLAGALYEDLCFDAQQAAEKAIKAVLVSQGVDFPKTHSLADLLTIAADAGLTVPDGMRDAPRLTRYAVETRYPGPWEELTREDYQQAIDLAEASLRWAESLIGSGPA